jgi:peptidyl-dipeptidase A
MDFKQFLNSFVPSVQQKSKQVNQAAWILETTGSHDAASLKAGLETELRLLFNNKETFDQLISWDKDASLRDPVLKRQLNVLIRQFKPNLISKELLEKIAHAEANLSLLYSNFRPELKGQALSENDIREILKRETNVQVRKETWEASKQIGKVLAPHILRLVHLRNDAAKSLGYTDYFSMQLELQEVDEKWLFKTLDTLAEKSDAAYSAVIDEINTSAAKRFLVSKDEIGPWAWSEPFCQEDPLDTQELDGLAEGVDLIETARRFYQAMDFNVEGILSRSDNVERPGKNQHAFCTHIDREGDVRTLNNIKPSIKWMETVLHELGHAVYELGFSSELPWLLKEPPHMITTEAMALLAGRQAYRAQPLEHLSITSSKTLREKAEVSLKRRQLIFSRWVLVMTYFERELYRDPNQNLNQKWWETVKRFQKIHSAGSASQCDWAAKYHIGLAPVYYFSYLLGEFFASSLEKKIGVLPSKKAQQFLNEKLFHPGNRLSWHALVEHATSKPLTTEDWLVQFA